MAARFIGKNPHRRVVRQIPNRFFSHRIENVKEEALEENNNLKETEDMADKRLKKIEEIVGTKAPKATVKREKKEKGLIERTENSVVLLTEDNKMLLKD